MCCLASGSKGNCCYVSDGETNLLIDLGISATRAEKCLSALGVDSDRIEILITHSHSDHIGGLKVFCKKHPSVTVRCQRESARAVRAAAGIEPEIDGRDFAVGGITVNAVPVSHDVPCFGYVVRNTAQSVAVVTDIGAVKTDMLDSLCGCGIVMLEANHDLQKLRSNMSYTAQLKARISSPYGHLSNTDCANACAYLARYGVKNFILAHLSEENNDPLLAVSEVTKRLELSGVVDAHVTAATQNAMTGLFEVC